MTDATVVMVLINIDGVGRGASQAMPVESGIRLEGEYRALACSEGTHPTVVN